MKTSINIILACALNVCSQAAPNSISSDPVRILNTSPLRFEAVGKRGAGRFTAQGLRYRFQFEANQIRFQTNGQRVDLRFEHASSAARVEGSKLLRSKTSRFIGNDRSKWETAIPNYGQLEVRGLYRGIDAVYYGNGGELEYDLHVAAGADPSQIRLRFSGGQPRIDADGNLVAGFIQKRPVAYQLAADGSRVEIESHYRQLADGSFGVKLGAFDRRKELTIDPVLTFSAYLGGSLSDAAVSIGHDSQGFIYVGGNTFSTDFPMVGNSEQGTLVGGSDVFLVKLDPKADPSSQIVYSTYIGGSSNDTLRDMVVTPRGAVYLAGTTASIDYPVANAAQTTPSGTTDAFVTWLETTQDFTAGLYYSTYIGGSSDDTAYGVAVDAAGRICLTGFTTSTDFPGASGFQSVLAGGQDAFVVVIDTRLTDVSTLVYSTYLGGTGTDAGRGIAVAPDGTLWVAGSTLSVDFPVVGNSYQPIYKPGGDGFLAHIDPNQGGNSLLYDTFLGGSAQDVAKRVVVSPAGNPIVSGITNSDDLPVSPDAYQPYYGGQTDVFLLILNPNISSPSRQLVYGTYFGGSQPDVVYDMKVDSSGIIYLTGTTNSPDMPVTSAALQLKYDRNGDAFVVRLDPSQAGLAGLQYSSYIGSSGTQIGYGVDFDLSGGTYVAGSTSGPLLDALGGATKTTGNGNTDGFVLGFGSCTLSLSFQSEQFPVGGGSDNVNVTQVGTCSWTTSSALSWVTVSPATGTSGGPVTITVAPNTTGSPRRGNIQIAGASFLIGQDGQ